MLVCSGKDCRKWSRSKSWLESCCRRLEWSRKGGELICWSAERVCRIQSMRCWWLMMDLDSKSIWKGWTMVSEVLSRDLSKDCGIWMVNWLMVLRICARCRSGKLAGFSGRIWI